MQLRKRNRSTVTADNNGTPESTNNFHRQFLVRPSERLGEIGRKHIVIISLLQTEATEG